MKYYNSNFSYSYSYDKHDEYLTDGYDGKCPQATSSLPQYANYDEVVRYPFGSYTAVGPNTLYYGYTPPPGLYSGSCIAICSGGDRCKGCCSPNCYNLNTNTYGYGFLMDCSGNHHNHGYRTVGFAAGRRGPGYGGALKPNYSMYQYIPYLPSRRRGWSPSNIVKSPYYVLV